MEEVSSFQNYCSWIPDLLPSFAKAVALSGTVTQPWCLVIANRFGVYGSCGVPGWRFLAFGLFGSPMTPPLYRWWLLLLGSRQWRVVRRVGVCVVYEPLAPFCDSMRSFGILVPSAVCFSRGILANRSLRLVFFSEPVRSPSWVHYLLRYLAFEKSVYSRSKIAT
ncbi:hypothetical protein IGI04_014846, partial [Brassica rapa subsp. trilocularis]